ncbi:MAG: hypothetical protein NE330_05290, partial [Lentisphaeraceae bacterium]|nr:hypothetical protein [Lentisphaeraceae bacterium]
MNKRYFSFGVLVLLLFLAYWAGKNIKPVFVVSESTIEAKQDKDGKTFYTFKDKPKYFDAVAHDQRKVRKELLESGESNVLEEFTVQDKNGNKTYVELKAQKHWGWWSLFPAFVAVFLCF